MVIGLSDTIYQLFYLSEYVVSLYGLGQGREAPESRASWIFSGELKIFRARPLGELI